MEWPKRGGVSSIPKGRNEKLFGESIVNPLVNGFLTGTLSASLCCALTWLKSDPNLNLPQFVRGNLLHGATQTTASLGMFEILRNKVKNSNNGKPLTLYQEAYCGIAAASTGAFIFQPFDRALSSQNVLTSLSQTFRNEGLLALWRGCGRDISTRIALNTGMLASYNPTRNYLIQSANFSEFNAQIVSGIVSGFSTAVCAHLIGYLRVVRGGTPIKEILTPHSGFEFYNLFRHNFKVFSVLCVVQWTLFEQIRKLTGGITTKLCTSIGKRYARTDELGVPLAITVDSITSVTVRERDNKQQVHVNVDEVASLVKEVTDGASTWADVQWRYPTHSS